MFIVFCYAFNHISVGYLYVFCICLVDGWFSSSMPIQAEWTFFLFGYLCSWSVILRKFYVLYELFYLLPIKAIFPVMFNCWWIWIYILILFQIMNHRYFIVKSCNRENLELSVQQGVWATQRSNEAKLNEAFDSAENVILIFSVNRTRHFQVVWSLMKKKFFVIKIFLFHPWGV